MSSDFPSEYSEMLCEACALIRRVAEPRPIGDSVKAAIGRAADRLGFTYTRTRRIWYSDARRIDAREMDRLRDAARELERSVTRLLALRDALARKDPVFHQFDIGAIDFALNRMGGVAPSANLPRDQAGSNGEV